MLDDLDKFQHAEQSKTRNEVSSKINIKIASKKVKALIDTAQVHAISKDLYDELSKSDVNMITIPIRRLTLRGAFADKGKLINLKTTFDVGINDKTYVVAFYVIRKLVYDMILGMDFLAKHHATINCTGKTVQLLLKKVAQIAALKRLSGEEAEAKLADMFEEHRDLFKKGIGCVNHYTHK